VRQETIGQHQVLADLLIKAAAGAISFTNAVRDGGKFIFGLPGHSGEDWDQLYSKFVVALEGAKEREKELT
jgi:hypothetical protein